MIKLGILCRLTHSDGLRRRISFLKSESEIEGSSKKLEEVKRALFGLTTERVKKRRKIILKDFNNISKLYYYIITSSELGDNMFIRNIIL
jgi:hypothetical protein